MPDPAEDVPADAPTGPGDGRFDLRTLGLGVPWTTRVRAIGIYTAIFAATLWGDGSRLSGTDLHRCRLYLLIRGRPRLQSLVSQGLRIRHPLVPSEGRHSRSVPSSCQ